MVLSSIRHTAADGVMSAEGLRADPSMFWEMTENYNHTDVPAFVNSPSSACGTVCDRRLALCFEYLALCKEHPMNASFTDSVVQCSSRPLSQDERSTVCEHLRYMLPFHLGKPRQIQSMIRRKDTIVLYPDVVEHLEAACCLNDFARVLHRIRSRCRAARLPAASDHPVKHDDAEISSAGVPDSARKTTSSAVRVVGRRLDSEVLTENDFDVLGQRFDLEFPTFLSSQTRANQILCSSSKSNEHAVSPNQHRLVISRSDHDRSSMNM